MLSLNVSVKSYCMRALFTRVEIPAALLSLTCNYTVCEKVNIWEGFYRLYSISTQ